ncbi:transmembrane protein 222 [Anthonomus grandis grandis]|uniref:transmembrane protein 222 n=1 Tax=Anthonomus grandis grandis TaxID=2921223 RepID=UPI0021664C0F|nr:transmembrane protein 222 [Anthonomus grandis grandis]
MKEDPETMSSPGYMDFERARFPFCIVWTPLPVLTWLFPIIGHMGICMSSGVIRDFAGPYFVSEDNMAFGQPTKYWQLDPALARGGITGWDSAVIESAEIYKTRLHNICCDNCHSHVATALNLMQYEGYNKWNMVKLALLITWHAKYVSFTSYLKTWLPFYILVLFLVLLCIFV